MDTSFWQAIVDIDFAAPCGSSVADLTPQLISFLSSTDPQLRDTFGFPILAIWIDRGGYYTPAQLGEVGAPMIHHLSAGLGESETDTVFGRAFSALILGKVIDADNRQFFLSADEVHDWLNQALGYIQAECDVRSVIPGNGGAQ